MGLIDLSAQHLFGETVEEVDEDSREKILLFHLGDDEDGVNINHEFGDPEMSALRILGVAEAMREHAERIRHRARMRSAGWT
ncbi:MAG TPA: hypothetical protein VL738_29645 [Dactylosporangium sp.]|jgi:hypothetical protein|nr:hypothetical protein [Dactylosporangium sp.]